MTLLLLLSPWILLGLYVAVLVRPPRPLPPPRFPQPGGGPADPPGGGALPFVSVVVPARNEARNIETCLASLTASRYPAFEVVVVDDRSEDGTPELARRAPRGNARRVEIVEGRPLPAGWFGKPWACRQGAERARGDLLLFTDADTVHGPDLLLRAVAGLREDGADALTVVGRQRMVTFWERLLQPHFFTILALRFPRHHRPLPPSRWRHAIANGQFLLFTRRAYEAVGSHEAVRGEVAEDLRFAQLLVAGGWRLSVRAAVDALETRMYRSLPEMVEGWSKNMATGARQTSPRLLRPFAIPSGLAAGVLLWLLPPATLVWGVVGGGAVPAWAALATAFDVLFWSVASGFLRSSPVYGLLYPVGSLVSGVILLRSWMQGPRIRWKGREYGPARGTA